MVSPEARGYWIICWVVGGGRVVLGEGCSQKQAGIVAPMRSKRSRIAPIKAPFPLSILVSIRL